MDSKLWKIKKADGSIYGPVNTETMIRWICEERISPEDLLSPEGEENWQSARAIPQFANMFDSVRKPVEKRVSKEWESTFKVKDSQGIEYGPIDFETLTRWIREGRVTGGKNYRAYTSAGNFYCFRLGCDNPFLWFKEGELSEPWKDGNRRGTSLGIYNEGCPLW